MPEQRKLEATSALGIASQQLRELADWHPTGEDRWYTSGARRWRRIVHDLQSTAEAARRDTP
jgi:hypothetical protein